jgi:hypothetical protein
MHLCTVPTDRRRPNACSDVLEISRIAHPFKTALQAPYCLLGSDRGVTAFCGTVDGYPVRHLFTRLRPRCQASRISCISPA